jgi:hypothetical protein
MLVVTLIIGVITTGLIGMLKRGWDNYDAIVVQNTVQKQARTALDIAAGEIRGMGPWNTSSVSVFEDANGSVIGSDPIQPYTVGAVSLRRTASNQLLRNEAVGTSFRSRTVVNNITLFRLQCVRRVATTTGALSWQTMPDSLTAPTVSALNSRTTAFVTPAAPDARLNDVALVYITVEASATARNGVTYSRRLQTAVRVRNNSYTAAPTAR